MSGLPERTWSSNRWAAQEPATENIREAAAAAEANLDVEMPICVKAYHRFRAGDIAHEALS